MFKIGDKVEVILGDYKYATIGTTGFIRTIDGNYVIIEVIKYGPNSKAIGKGKKYPLSLAVLRKIERAFYISEKSLNSPEEA